MHPVDPLEPLCNETFIANNNRQYISFLHPDLKLLTKLHLNCIEPLYTMYTILQWTAISCNLRQNKIVSINNFPAEDIIMQLKFDIFSFLTILMEGREKESVLIISNITTTIIVEQFKSYNITYYIIVGGHIYYIYLLSILLYVVYINKS